MGAGRMIGDECAWCISVASVREGDAMELLPGIHRVDGVICNVYVIVEREGLTLIDTGMPRSERKIGAYVRGIGRELGEVRRIVLTHQHVDHVGGAAALAEQTGAEVIASVGDA